MNDESLELLTLRQLGLADARDLARLRELLALAPDEDIPAQDFREVDDFLAEALVSAQPAVSPSPLLRERVMVATEPKLAQVVTDAQCGIVSISAPFTDLCGYTLPEIRGRSPGSFLQGPETDPAAVEIFREALRAQRACVVELINYHKCGTPYRVRIDMRPIFGQSGRDLWGYMATETKVSLR